MTTAPTVAILTHVPYEGPAFIEEHCHHRGWRAVEYPLYQQVSPPVPGQCDALVVMGGPMSVHDTRAFPWLSGERRCIERHLAGGTPVVGICLGAQLVAAALGARVYPHRQKEIGFWPVEFTSPAPAVPEAGAWARSGWTRAFRSFPHRATVFHWHGDTFDLPAGCVQRARSRGCEHQMFTLGEHVAGIQFHLEATAESVRALLQACRDEVGHGFYQPEASGVDLELTMLREARARSGSSRLLMRRILDACFSPLGT